MVVGVPGTLEAPPSASSPFPRAFRFSCHTEHFLKMQLGSRPPITALLAGEEEEQESRGGIRAGPWGSTFSLDTSWIKLGGARCLQQQPVLIPQSSRKVYLHASVSFVSIHLAPRVPPQRPLVAVMQCWDSNWILVFKCLE